jgi:DNA polymerase-1
MEPKKLFLLDAFALIYRAHFAFIKNPRINSKGMNTSAIFGFVNAMNDVISKQNPWIIHSEGLFSGVQGT